MWQKWVLDVSFEYPCFVPYERDTEQVVVGMNMLSARCPGELVGVIHVDGQDAAEKWCIENPDWLTRFGKEDGEEITMHSNYEDIRSRIVEEPSWYDENGTPRYGKFNPELCPSIYSDVVALLLIACQYCSKKFTVEAHAGIFNWRITAPPSRWHYGDPPIHGCTGDTMNCEDLAVLEVWRKNRDLEQWGWERQPEFEGAIDQEEEN